MTSSWAWRAVLPIVLGMSTVLGWGEDGADPQQGGLAVTRVPSQLSQSLYAEKDRDYAVGVSALQDMKENPHRGIDAAIAFGKVLAIDYSSLPVAGMPDYPTDWYIYFCRKAMQASDAKTYLLTKSTSDQEAFLLAEKVLTRETGQDVDGGVALAGTARSDEKNKIGLEAIVVDTDLMNMFSGTSFAEEASQDLGRAQDRYAAQLAQEQEDRQAKGEDRFSQHQTRFNRDAMHPTGDLIPIPPAQEQAVALQAITAQYGVRDDLPVACQRVIARQLAADADLKRMSPAGVYSMLQLSERLAQASEEYETLLSDIETEGGMFAAVHVAKKATGALRAMDKLTAKAVLKLIQDPSSGEANTTVGLFYVCQLHLCDLGMDMLASGSDQHLSAAVKQEWQAPTTIAEQIAMGDTWYGIGQKAAPANRGGIWARAERWYQRAEMRTAGKSLQHVTSNLQAIDKAYQESLEDWSAITLEEYGRLQGQSFLLDAHLGQLDTGLSLKAGQSMRIVVAPRDCWTWKDPSGLVTTAEACTGYEVKVSQPDHGQGGLERQGVLTMGLNDGAPVTFGLVTGPGELWLYAENPGKLLGSGTVRVIIFPDPNG
jgi:hypothetical protein